MKKKKFSDLKFVRCIDPAVMMVVPRYLWEYIPGMKAEYIDNIYHYAVEIMTVPVVNEELIVVRRIPSNNVWFALLYDEVHHVKGVLWAEFDTIFRRVFIQACAVDKQYQSSNGEVLQGMIDYIRSLALPDDMRNNIQIATTRPAAFQKAGLKRSSNILMELKNEPEITEPTDRGSQERSDVPDGPR